MIDYRIAGAFRRNQREAMIASETGREQAMPLEGPERVASVVIPCYNAGRWLAEQLDALVRQTADAPTWEVLLVDNGSTDGSMAVAQGYAGRLPNLRLLAAREKRGASHARNVGVREARGEFVLFCDADDVVADDWIAAMCRALRQHPFVGCRIEHTRLNPDWSHGSRDAGQSTGLHATPFLPYAGSGTIGIRRDIYLRVGGFNELMRTVEDQDFCWRVQLSGVPLVFVADAVLHYRHRQNLRAAFRQTVRYGIDWSLMIRRFRREGHTIPTKTWRGFAREVALMLGRLPSAMCGRGSLAAWTARFGYHLGQLVGSFLPLK